VQTTTDRVTHAARWEGALRRWLTHERASASAAGARGPGGNARLTATTGLVLLALLAVEGVTLVAMGPLLSVHVFVGVLLIPPVLLKLASTGYRFVRYYTRDRAYRAAGPPHTALRLLAPLVVASTAALLGTGVLMLVLGPPARWLVAAHIVSFAVWVGAVGVHVLAHLPRVVTLSSADARGPRHERHGVHPRRVVVGAALVIGLAAAVVALPSAVPWHALVG